MNYQFQPTCQIEPEILDKIYTDAFGVKANGFFVEVGAHDGWHWSNTWGLAEIGWHGLYVEPQQDLYDECCKTNSGRKNIRSIQCCISDKNGEVELGHAEYGSSLLSQKDLFKAKSFTLNTFLETMGVPVGFDLLVIDVEGAEPQVLSGFTVSQWLPQLVIIERPEEPNQMTERGYATVFQNWINTVYQRQ
jgi:FkbM family methyltransferase